MSCDFVGCHGTNAPRHFLQLGDRRMSEKGNKNKNIECFALARIEINVGTSFGILLNYTCVYIHTLDFSKGKTRTNSIKRMACDINTRIRTIFPSNVSKVPQE